MIYDKSTNRFILESGKFIVSDDDYCMGIVNGDLMENVLVLDSEDAQKYQMIIDERIVFVDTDDEFDFEQEDLTEDDHHEIMSRIFNSPRYEENVQTDLRIQKELEFFYKSNTMVLLKKLIELIDKFKTDGVVWGVGRGSSCSSYVLYLLEVHDIDPLKYNIPFTEMSKE